MKGIDDLKKWSEETAEYVVDKKSNGAQGQGEKAPVPEKKNAPEEIDLLGLDEPAPKPTQTQPQSNIAINKDDGTSKPKFPTPPIKKEGGAQAHVEQEIDLLGNDFTPSPKPSPQLNTQPAQSKPISNLDLFDLNLNM